MSYDAQSTRVSFILDGEELAKLDFSAPPNKDDYIDLDGAEYIVERRIFKGSKKFLQTNDFIIAHLKRTDSN